MDAGVPLHQIAKSAPSWPPLMNLLHALRLGPPQLGCNHPLPYGLPAYLHVVFVVEVFSRQRRSKSSVHVLQQNLDRPAPFLLFDLAVGWKSPQGMNYGLIAP